MSFRLFRCELNRFYLKLKHVLYTLYNYNKLNFKILSILLNIIIIINTIFISNKYLNTSFI